MIVTREAISYSLLFVKHTNNSRFNMNISFLSPLVASSIKSVSCDRATLVGIKICDTHKQGTFSLHKSTVTNEEKML